jgi:uncharacterized protein YdeI (BOF family)
MNFPQRNTTAAALVLGILCTGTVSAEQEKQPNPYLKPDDTWISISGTVKSVTRDSFTLDFGDGMVIVEMDDGDRDADAYKLVEGDKVTVNGMIDDDFFETTSIEASSVYVEKLGTYFYASPVDEEDFTVWYTIPVAPGQAVVQGKVTKVQDDELIVNTGLRSITVEVDDMAYNPLDDEGYQKIEVGDTVRAIGTLDDELFDDQELEAESVVTLVD